MGGEGGDFGRTLQVKSPWCLGNSRRCRVARGLEEMRLRLRPKAKAGGARRPDCCTPSVGRAGRAFGQGGWTDQYSFGCK